MTEQLTKEIQLYRCQCGGVPRAQLMGTLVCDRCGNYRASSTVWPEPSAVPKERCPDCQNGMFMDAAGPGQCVRCDGTGFIARTSNPKFCASKSEERADDSQEFDRLRREIERLQRERDDFRDRAAEHYEAKIRLRAALERIASGDIIQGMSHELFATKVLDGMPPDETTAKLTCGCVTKCDPASLQAGEVCVNSLL